MLVYWLLLAYFAVGVLLQRQDPQQERQSASMFLIFGAILIALLVGLRFEVGADWMAYLKMLSLARYSDLGQLFERGDPAYQILNVAAVRAGGDIWAVNLICAAIFSWGLLRFCRTQSDPWVAMLVAIPYLVIVIAMGYTRQGVAIGLLMAGLASLQRGASIAKFALYVAFAALFHKSAVIALLLVLLRGRRNFAINVSFVLAAAFLLYSLLLEDSIALLTRNYLDAGYSSEGAFIRVVMSVVPAILFFLFRKRLGFQGEESALWRNFSLSALALLILLFVLPSSTAVDRVALYLLPLQLVIAARVPGKLLGVLSGRMVIVAYSVAVLFVWLNYATHATYWLPYRFYPTATAYD